MILHISFGLKAGITNPNMVGSLITTNIPAILLLDTVTRFTVPCFVVLAGAFTLENKKNADSPSYYRKAFRSIGILMILFSLFSAGCSMVSH